MRALRPLGLGFTFIAAVGLGLAMLLVAPPASADGGFRCGSRIIRNGETEDDVAGKCGDPDAVRTWTETQTEAVWENGHKLERSVPVEYSEWKYDFGRDRFIRYLTFVRGRLASVRTGEYGRR